MNWEEVCRDPILHNLPYKIELNQWGQIIMSPASIRHIAFQKRISDLIDSVSEKGETLQEFPIKTSENVKVADVVWISDMLFRQVIDESASPVAPEICVEVMSPGNSKAQMQHKGKLYFDAGAKEFWTCDKKGNIRFYNRDGKLKRSVLIPDFPKKIEEV